MQENIPETLSPHYVHPRYRHKYHIFSFPSHNHSCSPNVRLVWPFLLKILPNQTKLVHEPWLHCYHAPSRNLICCPNDGPSQLYAFCACPETSITCGGAHWFIYLLTMYYYPVWKVPLFWIILAHGGSKLWRQDRGLAVCISGSDVWHWLQFSF